VPLSNLQLTIELGSGVALGHPWINGEGLIQWLALVDAKGKEVDRFIAELDHEPGDPTDLRVEGHIDTGLAYTNDVAHASASQFDTDRRASTTLYSSYDEVRAHSVEGSQPRTKIPISGGQFKSQMITVEYLPARRCTFYLRGDRGRLKTLLSRHLTDLGKRTAAGFGQIVDWGLREIDIDASVVHPRHAVAMRPVPTAKLDDWSDAATLTWRAPYHYQPWADQCAPPGADVSGWQ
jgi:hypothetical protein